MATRTVIQDLSNELIREILDRIAADPDKLVGVDKRAYLSQESFKPPPPPSTDRAADIGSFRLTCKRFAALGITHQFSRVTTRFNWNGFYRLENIARQPHVAKHVKKFSYLVPPFYKKGQEWYWDQLEPRMMQDIHHIDLSSVVQRAKDQCHLVDSGDDARVLNKALSSFVNLQHVQILRVQDSIDERLLTLLRNRRSMARYLDLKWPPACLHSARTIGMALASSPTPISRFSSPMLNPQSVLVLARHPPLPFHSLAERLTCLELHFEDGLDLEPRMLDLSTAFGKMFTAAINMEVVHIGFPSHRPLSLPLESIFHGVQWPKLLAFGIQGWRLSAEEIIGLARRHKDRLRGLRLRDVLLTEESMWKDVLGFLRGEMVHLDWVSLRRIGYAKWFDGYRVNIGIEVPDHDLALVDEKDSEPSDDETMHWSSTQENEYESDESSDRGSDSGLRGSDSDDERGPQAHELAFPRLRSPNASDVVAWCNCDGGGYPEGIEDLGDDGLSVDNAKRKRWEQWVVRRCPEHSVRG